MRDTELTEDFVKDFLLETEKKWENSKIDEGVYGFQLQPGTKWNPGLSREDISIYETALGIKFPNDLITFLRHANGTDRPTINIYGNSGYPHQYAPGVYCFPQHLEAIKQRVEQLANGSFLEALEIEGCILGEKPSRSDSKTAARPPAGRPASSRTMSRPSQVRNSTPCGG